jgi:hypothetical protein
MPTSRRIVRPVALRTTFPADIRARLDLYLFSELEGKVPKGAYQAFLVERMREFFEHTSLDISPWLEPLGSPLYVRGSPNSIDALASHLESMKCSSETL